MKKNYRSIDYRKLEIYKDISETDWNDWKWQLGNAIRDIPSLKKIIDVSEELEADLEKCLQRFKMAITPYYASLMDQDYDRGVIRLQAVPTLHELQLADDDQDDPLHEDEDSPVPGLTHRYPDRVLMLVTHTCSMYCRHCTRRRMVGDRDVHLSRSGIDACIEYIKNHPEVRDVLLSGGDPLTLTDGSLEYILKKIRDIDHVEIIRVGSRMPVVLPQRITESLVSMLKKYHPLYVNTHFNHPDEITLESKQACERLTDGGIPVGKRRSLFYDKLIK